MRLLETSHVPEKDQVSCSTDGMCVKVTCSTTCWFTSLQNFDANLSCFSTLPHHVTCSRSTKCKAFGWHGLGCSSQLRSKMYHCLTTCCRTLFTGVTIRPADDPSTHVQLDIWTKVETTCAGAANRTRRRTQIVCILTWYSLFGTLTTLVERCVAACVEPFAALCGRFCEALQGQHHLGDPPSRQQQGGE